MFYLLLFFHRKHSFRASAPFDTTFIYPRALNTFTSSTNESKHKSIAFFLLFSFFVEICICGKLFYVGCLLLEMDLLIFLQNLEVFVENIEALKFKFFKDSRLMDKYIFI